MSIIDDIRSGSAEITGGSVRPTETLVKQTREAVQRMRGDGTDEKLVFRGIHVTRADAARGKNVWAAWKAGDVTVYMKLKIDGQMYLLFSPERC